jgi:hypothetical protein
MSKPDSPFRYFNSSPEVIRLIVMVYGKPVEGWTERYQRAHETIPVVQAPVGKPGEERLDRRARLRMLLRPGQTAPG